MATTPLNSPTWLLLLSMAFCILQLTSPVNAQCEGSQDPVISFPESDPTVPFPGGSTYLVKLLDGLPDDVEITNEDNDVDAKFQFADVFEIVRRLDGIYVRMTSGLDRDGENDGLDDDQNVFQYKLKCVAVTGQPAVFRVLKIQIIDVNDNAPKFKTDDSTVPVAELTPVGLTVVRSISATDIDSGVNRQIEYSLSKAADAQFDGVPYFRFPSVQEGLIIVDKGLDFEEMYRATGDDASKTFYKLIITAKDGNVAAPLSSTRTLSILVTDSDDLGPTFEYPSCIKSGELFGKPCIRATYTTSVVSDSNANSALTLLPEPVDTTNPTQAVSMVMYDRDTLDSPISCSISYTIPNVFVNSFAASAQQIGTSKKYQCVVSQIQAVSRATVSDIQLIIEAVEVSDNRRVDYATVVVAVNPSSNNDPIITPSTATGYIYENSAVKSRVFTDSTASSILKLVFSDPDVVSWMMILNE